MFVQEISVITKVILKISIMSVLFLEICTK